MDYIDELEQHLTLIAQPAGHEKAKIIEALQGLDALAKTHADELSADLKHYLQRRSYEKALNYIKGQSDIKRGTCGGKDKA